MHENLKLFIGIILSAIVVLFAMFLYRKFQNIQAKKKAILKLKTRLIRTQKNFGVTQKEFTYLKKKISESIQSLLTQDAYESIDLLCSLSEAEMKKVEEKLNFLSQKSGLTDEDIDDFKKTETNFENQFLSKLFYKFEEAKEKETKEQKVFDSAFKEIEPLITYLKDKKPGGGKTYIQKYELILKEKILGDSTAAEKLKDLCAEIKELYFS